jgi:hypothetical protein
MWPSRALPRRRKRKGRRFGAPRFVVDEAIVALASVQRAAIMVPGVVAGSSRAGV